MKRFVLSVFLIFAGFSVFAQTYDDWDKLFTENKKDNIDDTYSSVVSALENGNYPEIMASILELYALKCNIVCNNTENFNNTILYNSKYDAGLKYYNSYTFKMSINNFTNYLKDENLFVYNITNLDKYDISLHFQPVSVREIELLPERFEDRQVLITGRYQYATSNTASFLCFDSSEGWKVVNFPYNKSVALQLLDMTKNTNYKICGTIIDGMFVIEYLEIN